jgi:hypothetical protein
MTRRELVKVLTASARPEVHSTIGRALALLGEQDAASLQLFRADDAEATLNLATKEKPRIAFLDVGIGGSAGISLVHFLQVTVPGLVVIAIVLDNPEPGAAAGSGALTASDVRLAEQASSLGAAHVIIGELTGDDVLRAFGKVAPYFVAPVSLEAAPTQPPPPPAREAPTQPPAPITDARSFADLDARLSDLSRSLIHSDPRAPLLSQLRSAIEQCVVNERSQRAPIQDVGTSAYSFAYFVDLAGREIDLARRHGRRVALATVEVALDARLEGRAAVELVLAAVRDTDVVARADDQELLLLLPETGTKGARTLRRRILDRTESHARASGSKTLPMRVGLASFPFDGEDLSRLLRIARRRSERWASIEGAAAVSDALERAVKWLADADGAPSLEHDGTSKPFVPMRVPMREAWSLLDTLVRESTRAGDTIIGLHAPHDATEAPLGLAQSIRASTSEAFGPLSGNAQQLRADGNTVVTVVTGTSRLVEGAAFSPIEVVGILSEHACYGLIGRVTEGHLVALQTHELPIVEALVQGLEQPILRRGAVVTSNSGRISSAAPSAPTSSVRSSRSDPRALRGRE